MKPLLVVVVSFAGGVAGAFLASNWLRNSNIQTIKTNRLTIVDPAERVRAEISSTNVSVDLSLFSALGHRRLALSLSEHGLPQMNFYGRDGKERVTILLTDRDLPSIILSDESFEGRLKMGYVTADFDYSGRDEWAVQFRSKNGNPATLFSYRSLGGQYAGRLIVRSEASEAITLPLKK